MFRLRLLGSLDLVSPDGAQVLSVLAQPKRLALLAYLAADPARHLSRDKLIGVFWPDRDEDDAHNALRQALHHLRRSLAESVIINRGDGELRVDHDLLECDVVDFEQSIAAGDLEKALELYRGDLVEDLYVSGCPEFDHWRDRRSATLRRSAVEAARTLTRRREEAGDLTTAVEFAQRAVGLAPADESHVQTLMRLLVSCGDRGGAVLAYQEFESRFQAELGLEPSAETQNLVQEIRDATVPGASTRRPPDADLAPRDPAGPRPVTPVPDSPAVAVSAPRHRIGIAAAAASLVIATIGVVLIRGAVAGKDDTVPRLIVLPFVNLSSSDNDYFADGMTEEITSTLSNLSGLRVIARQTAIQYVGSPLSAREIAVELDLDFVLEGTVRTDRGQVRITPQLIRASDETHVWAEPYTVDLVAGEIFRVQGEIAARVAEGMDVVLSRPEQVLIAVGGTESREAYDYYLRGISYRLTLRRLDVTRMAADMFELAVAADPEYVEAHAMLARTYSSLGSADSFGQADALPKAREAAERVIQLAPDHPAAHMALGEYHQSVTRRLDLAEQHFQAARQARPNDASVLWRLAQIQSQRGKSNEAVANLEEALVLDPRSEGTLRLLAGFQTTAGRYAEAEALYDRAIVLEPVSPWIYFRKILLYLRWDGSTDRAKGVVVAAAGRADLVNFLLVSWDFDDALVLRVFADHFDDAIRRRTVDGPADSVAYYFAKGNAVGRNLSATEAEAYYDSARVVLERRLENLAEPGRTTRNLGLAYAHLGNTEDARRIAAGLSLKPIVAEIYMLIGDYDAAVDLLEQLSGDWPVFAPILRVDPLWDPLRNNRRFQALLAKFEN